MDNYNGSNLDQTFTPRSIIETTINPPPIINGPQSLSSQFSLPEKNIGKVKIGLKNILKINPKFSVGKNNKIQNYGKLLEEDISSSSTTSTTTTKESPSSTLIGTTEISASTTSSSTTTTSIGSTTTGPSTTTVATIPTSTTPFIGSTTTGYSQNFSITDSTTSLASTSAAITDLPTSGQTTTPFTGPTTAISSTTTKIVGQTSSTKTEEPIYPNTTTTDYFSSSTITSFIDSDNDNNTTSTAQQTSSTFRDKVTSSTTATESTTTTITTTNFNTPSTSDSIVTDYDNVTESFNTSTTTLSTTVSFSTEENNDTTTTLPNSTPSPTTTTTRTPLPMTTTTEKVVDENPPPPILNCKNDILQAACQDPITNTTLPKDVSKAINDTKTKITEKINDGQFNSTDIHDTGAYLYNITLTVSSLDTESVKSIIEIINAVAKNASLEHLQVSSELTKGSMLWYIDSVPKIVDLADSDININGSDSKNLQLHSQSLNKSFCDLKEVSPKEICQETENGKFCAIFDPKQLCGTGAKKVYIALWSDLKFHIVSNNAYNGGIKFGSDSKTQKVDEKEENKNTTEKNLNYFFSNAGDCETGIRLYSPGGVNTGGTGGNNKKVSFKEFSTLIKFDRKKDQNDLHVVAKQAVFKGRIFTFEEGGKVSRGSETYEAECPSGTTCTITFEGNTSDPVTCTPILRYVEGAFGAIGAAVTLFSFIAYLIHKRNPPLQIKCCYLFFDILLDRSLSSKARKFAFAYNVTFTLYIIYLIAFSYRKSLASDWICTASAVVGYLLYLWGIFLTIILLIVTLEELGKWRPTFQFSLQLITGFEKTYVPFIYGFGIPLIMTLIFSATMVAFFKRNDGYCWIRPDYSIPALWIPLILLYLSLPLYILIIARKWPTYRFAKFVNRLCCCGGTTQIDNVEAAAENLSIVLEEQNNTAPSVEEIRSNHIISRLIVPQIFLGIPLIAENFTLYYAKLTGWHYAFILTLAAHLIILYSVSVYTSYKTAKEIDSYNHHSLTDPQPDSISPQIPKIDSRHQTTNGGDSDLEENENVYHILIKQDELKHQPLVTRSVQPRSSLKSVKQIRRPSGIYANPESDSSTDDSITENESEEGFEEPIEIHTQRIKNVENYIPTSSPIAEIINICTQCQSRQSPGNYFEAGDTENVQGELSTEQLLDFSLDNLRVSHITETQCNLVEDKESRRDSQNENFCDEKENPFQKVFKPSKKSGNVTDYENNEGENYSEESESEKNENMSATETSQISNDFNFTNFFHHKKQISVDDENVESGNENETRNLCDDGESLGISSNETISLDNFDDENKNFDNLSSSSSCPFPETENGDLKEEEENKSDDDDDDHCDFSDMEENSEEK